MKVDVALDELKRGLQVIKETIGTDSQGHEGIKIYASKKTNRIKLTTTDGSFTTEIWVPAGVKEAGKFVVKAKKFIAYVSKLDVQTVMFSVSKAGGLVLKTKPSRGQQTFISYEEELFPSTPKFKPQFSFDMAGRIFKQLVNNVAFATDTGKDTARPYLQGIHFKSNGKSLEVVSTNGLTIAHYRRKLTSEEFDVVLGKKSLVNCAKLVGEDEKVSMQACENNHFIVKTGLATYHLPTLAGNFPDVKRVLPGKEFDLEFLADKDELLKLLDRASIMIEDSGILQFETGKVTLTGKSQESNFSEFIMTKLQGEASDVSVNVKRMIDVVKHIDSDMITIGVRDKQPLTLRPEASVAHTCILATG